MIIKFQDLRISTIVVAAASQKLALILLIFVLSLQKGKAQDVVRERHYEITVLGFNIGEMTANRSSSRDTTIYKVTSEVSFWFLGKVNVEFNVDSRIKNKQVVWSRSFSSSNKGDFQSEVKWNGKMYEVDASTYKFENTKPIIQPVSLCSVMLFFHEPKGGEDFLGEVFGLVSKVKKIENNGYEVTINGNTNRFSMKTG